MPDLTTYIPFLRDPEPTPVLPERAAAAAVETEPTDTVSATPEAAIPEAAGDMDEIPGREESTDTTPDYLPPLVDEEEPTRVVDAPTRPRRARRAPQDAASSMPLLSEGEAAVLWGRLPRHIQLLVGMSEPQEEVAQKYYRRGFKESRGQLIERLLDPTLSLEDTARILGVCPTTVRRYTNRGVLPHQRTVGQQRRFRLSDVLAFLENQSQRGGPGASRVLLTEEIAENAAA